MFIVIPNWTFLPGLVDIFSYRQLLHHIGGSDAIAKTQPNTHYRFLAVAPITDLNCDDLNHNLNE